MTDKKGFVLNERDIMIIKEVGRWKFLLGRQIRKLASFSGERACDRRLKKLVDGNYLERKHILYGIPGLYFLGSSSRFITGPTYKYKYKLDDISHNIAVVDTVIYLIETLNLKIDDFKSERQLHSLDGFSNRKHQPDFVFTEDGKNYCVEVELTPKNRQRFIKNAKDDFHNYDGTIWVIPKDNERIRNYIENSGFPYMNIIYFEYVEKYVRPKK